MDEICTTIKSFLKKYRLTGTTEVYLVAFSGGYDSMCLLDALKKSYPDAKIIALHLNHQWRGEESDREEDNCRRYCLQNNIEFYCENLPQSVPKTETAARDARYEFFERCAEKFNSRVVFTAHNANDNAETIIYRLCKGTGITGLCGISPHRGIYYRPLLTISREKIEKYCSKHSLKPNIDSSNSNTKYKRNFIRAEILPRLQKISTEAVNKINSLSDIAKDECEIITEYIELTTGKISNGNKIDTKKFFNLSTPLQKQIIYKIYTDNKTDCDKNKILYLLKFLKDNAGSKSGKTCSLTDNIQLFINERYFEVIYPQPETDTYFHITKEGKYENDRFIFVLEKFDKEVKKFPNAESSTAYVDLKRFPVNFEIRTRQDGDYIYPFGFGGKQKLKKYLNAKKIPNHCKDAILLLTSDKEVLWAINYGISDRIKVTTKPTHRIKFYEKEQNNDNNLNAG